MEMLRVSDGVELAVDVWGDGPRSVVLVHGLASSVEVCWRRPGIVDRLCERGLRVVAFDLRAHGRSDAPIGEHWYGDDRLVSDLREVVAAHAGQRPVLAGYSLGAAVVLMALAAGVECGAAVVGAPPPAVLRWSEADAALSSAAVAALRGHAVTPELTRWAEQLRNDGSNLLALAELLAAHRPVLRHWRSRSTPVTVVIGANDVMAAAPAELSAMLGREAGIVVVAGADHIGGLLSPQFTAAIEAAAAA